MFEFQPEVRHASISLTPLIDVVFILLLFFMLATRFDVWQVDSVSTTPVAAAGSAVDDTSSITITVAAGSSHSLGGATLTTNDLNKKLGRISDVTPDTLVIVHAENGTRVQQLYDVIGIVKASGLHRMQLTSADDAE